MRRKRLNCVKRRRGKLVPVFALAGRGDSGNRRPSVNPRGYRLAAAASASVSSSAAAWRRANRRGQSMSGADVRDEVAEARTTPGDKRKIEKRRVVLIITMSRIM